MKKNIWIVSIGVVFMLSGFNKISNSTKIKYPDEIDMFSILSSRTYMGNFKCGDLRQANIGGKTKIVITKKKEIREMCALFDDQENFKIDSAASDLDVRIEIDFIKNGEIVKMICSSGAGFRQVEMSGKVYSYNEAIGNLFSKYELIR